MRPFYLIDHAARAPWFRELEGHDAERAESSLAIWRERSEAAGDASLAALSEDADGRRFLAFVFGNSPFLGQSLLRDMAFTHELLAKAPEDTFHATLDRMMAAGPERPTATLMQDMRVAKLEVALVTGLADLAGIWNLADVTHALSDFADRSLALATEHLLRFRAEAGELDHPPRETNGEDTFDRPSGYFVLAMGKLGARELNYSSDIDLIVLYDEDRVHATGKRAPRDLFVRLTRDLVRVIQERTPSGYVFRTDLRLRPDAGSTPIALTTAFAESYYESLGRNWERAALIKARPVAGDREAATAFLRRLDPFVWRKRLDFAAIDDIRAISRQIHHHYRHGPITVPGHDIKLGRGGIREIEFFVQTHQLIAGGREPELRRPATLDAIDSLAALGYVPQDDAASLVDAYRFLRTLEHRLQMVNDDQIHRLPATEDGLAHIGKLMRFGSADDFAEALRTHLERVHSLYEQQFAQVLDKDDIAPVLLDGPEKSTAALEILSGLGFGELRTALTIVRGWQAGRYRSLRTERAREFNREILAALLEAFAGTVEPDPALRRFDEFLAKLPAGVQLFALFRANPWLLELVAEIMGSAPALAASLSANPVLIEAVLEPGFYDPLPDAAALAEDLAGALALARDYEDILDITRRWANDRRFQVGVQVLRLLVDADQASDALSNIAEVVIRALEPAVQTEFAKSHGRIEGRGLAILAMGKLGAREMTFGSDLDLILIYDAEGPAQQSDGPKPLAGSQYFTRLIPRFINALSAQTGEGRLYDVDMRLRPSGNKGPLAATLESFRSYHAQSSWTWEHMALTRARVVSGDAGLAEEIEALRLDVLTRKRDAAKLRRDVAEMRRRIAREYRSRDPWEIKYVRGGLLDLEFIAQYLELRDGHRTPGILAGNTAVVFTKLGEADLLDREEAMFLAEAARFLRGLQGLLRLCVGGPFSAETMPEGLRRMLARHAGVANFPALEDKLEETESRVRAAYEAHIESPAAADAALARAAPGSD